MSALFMFFFREPSYLSYSQKENERFLQENQMNFIKKQIVNNNS